MEVNTIHLYYKRRAFGQTPAPTFYSPQYWIVQAPRLRLSYQKVGPHRSYSLLIRQVLLLDCFSVLSKLGLFLHFQQNGFGSGVDFKIKVLDVGGKNHYMGHRLVMLCLIVVFSFNLTVISISFPNSKTQEPEMQIYFRDGN